MSAEFSAFSPFSVVQRFDDPTGMRVLRMCGRYSSRRVPNRECTLVSLGYFVVAVVGWRTIYGKSRVVEQ